MKRVILSIAACAAATCVRGIDFTWNYAVEITASVQASPAQITLNWKQDTAGTPASYSVYRKPPAGSSWGTPLATLPGSTTNFTDTSVAAGGVYEYQIVKDFTATSGYSGYGYIQAGINAPLVDSRGTVILVVDNTFASALAPELARLQQDLVGDGWVVIRHDVGRTDSVVSVKALIRADYKADPSNVNTVFLFGHVPVPYSGLLNPDGHSEHLGAWPADVYYGDMDGQWTDTTVNFVQTENTDPADAARITNIPGDGKFDQSIIPGVVKLSVGRVDLANMPGDLEWQSNPSFPSEQDLLRQYLNKDHNFRHTLLTVQRRGLIGDYIGSRDGIAFAAAGFRSFAPLFGFGDADIVNLNIQYNDAQGHWIPTLKTDAYLFAFGCGAGSYSSVSGIGLNPPYDSGTTTDMVSNDIRAVFVMLFGSWCGDWDHGDDIVRSVLATPTYGLAAVWSGAPHWFFHPLGLGETLGYCARLTQNNTESGLYRNQINLSANRVHIALMGDPTLRLHPVTPVSSLTGSSSAGQVSLSWAPSNDPSIAGYHVYRAGSAAGPFTRLTASPISNNSFTDSGAAPGATYMVRAIKLESTPSGSYFNASQGAFYTSSAGAGSGGSQARLVNLSVLAEVQGPLIMGFVIGGSGTSGAETLLIRGIGPALARPPFNLQGVLPDPALKVIQQSTAAVIASNAGWATPAGNASRVDVADSATGAFALTDTSSLDAALVATLPAVAGGYAVQATGKSGDSGTLLAEVYEDTSHATATTPRLINLSCLKQIAVGGNLSAGFVIAGTTSEKILVRATGPALTVFRVSGVMADPRIVVQPLNSATVLASNAGWGGDLQIAAAAKAVGAFGLADPASKDSAVLLTLAPGPYTVQVSSVSGAGGNALVEVYEVP